MQNPDIDILFEMFNKALDNRSEWIETAQEFCTSCEIPQGSAAYGLYTGFVMGFDQALRFASTLDAKEN